MQYYRLEKLINLYDGYRRAFKIDAHQLLLLQENNRCFLIEGFCPHRGQSLDAADLDGTELVCPRHHYRFDIGSGALLRATEEPCRNLRRYELIYRDTEIGVML